MSRAIIVASFGATSPSLRARSIDPFERAIAERFPDRRVYRAFTSPIVRERIESKEGTKVPGLAEAFEAAISDGMRDVCVLPALPIGGLQFDHISRVSDGYEGRFDKVSVCPPLLESRESIERFLSSLPSVFPDAFRDSTALVMMGHGNSAVSDGYLCRLQTVSSMLDWNAYFVTITGTPSPEDVVRMLSARNIGKVCLAPLMFEAGFHAHKDMCTGKESVRTVLERHGFETECIMLGMSEIPAFREMFIDGLRRCFE
ncbi:MAG: sirohydrochlorin cobaltochelatase [Candidatus Methanomethylophilaceae archaeon]|nr:sirohydrochlorin cobaltochelatase [Candidatus Methanomethylophilaceae archaeon]